MTKNKVRKLYSRKLEDEMDEFISGMKKLKKEEIMACAYRIYIMHCIYEYMLDVQDELSKNELKKIVEQSSIISDLYWKWIKTDISDNDELLKCIDNALKEIFEMEGAR